MTDVHGITRMVHSLEVGQGWVDPGLSIVGTLDPRLDGPHVQVEGGKLDMARPTRPQQPAIITYSLTDIAGNEATPVGRLVHITCPEGEHICPEEAWSDGLACSSMKLCNAPADLVEMNIPWLSVADNEPLNIALNGNSTVELTVGTKYDRCEHGSAPWHICDRGVVVTSGGAVVGQESSHLVSVQACPRERGSLIDSYDFHVAGLAGCLVDTQAVGTYTITFVATDLSGSQREGTVTRIIKVLPDCGRHERVCSDGSCSVDGVCISQDGSLTDLPATGSELEGADGGIHGPDQIGISPSLQLADGINRIILVKQNFAITECLPGQPFLEDKPCVPAPIAVDSEGNDISSWVYILPGDEDPMLCLSDGCTGTEFAVAGIAPAGIDTSAPVGTVFSFKFVVIDSVGQLSSIEQWVGIVPPCDDGGSWCDEQCLPVPCEVKELLPELSQSGAAGAALQLVGPNAITIGYGSSLPGSVASLLPCRTPAEVLAKSCGATVISANAESTADLLSGLGITDVTVCPEGSNSCPRCSPGLVGHGPLHCLPGVYTYEYSLLASSTENVSLTRTVIIKEGAGTLQLQISLPLGDEIPNSSVDEALTKLLSGTSAEAMAVREQLLALVNNAAIGYGGEDLILLSAVQVDAVSLLSAEVLQVTVHITVPHRSIDLVQSVLDRKMSSSEPIVRDVFVAAARRVVSRSSGGGQLVAQSYSPPPSIVDTEGGAMASLVSTILQMADQMLQLSQQMEKLSTLTSNGGLTTEAAGKGLAGSLTIAELAFLQDAQAMFSTQKVRQYGR